MTTAEKLRLAERIEADNKAHAAEYAEKKKAREALMRALAVAPGLTVSPIEAAALLDCDPYSLNLSAKDGTLGIRHIFAGRNLRIFKTDLFEACGFGRKEVAP